MSEREDGGGHEDGAGNDVRPDGHDVSQSRAVDMVRENLNVLGTSPGRAGIIGGLGELGGFNGADARSSQTSQGRDSRDRDISGRESRGHGPEEFGGQPRERERRKSVKFASADGL